MQVLGQRHEAGGVVEPAVQREHARRVGLAATQSGDAADRRVEGEFAQAARGHQVHRRHIHLFISSQAMRGQDARMRPRVVEAGDVAQRAAARGEVLGQHHRHFFQRFDAIHGEARRDHVDLRTPRAASACSVLSVLGSSHLSRPKRDW